MLYFENKIDAYIEDTGNHVMYRVTPIYYKNDLLPRGVHMQGYSVEDEGKGISFNVYCYNVQPGVTIDYASGRSCRSGETLTPAPIETEPSVELTGNYILNTNSKKIHKTDCKNATNMSEENKRDFSGDIFTLAAEGYTCCSICLKGVELPAVESSNIVSTETKLEAPQESVPETSPETDPESEPSEEATEYILNVSSKKIHLSSCKSAVNLSESNKKSFSGDIAPLLAEGYTCCGICLKDVEIDVPENIPESTAKEEPETIEATESKPLPETKPESIPLETVPETTPKSSETVSQGTHYILNTDSKKIHVPGCYHANRLEEDHKQDYIGDIEDLLADEYTKCGWCFK